MNKWESKLGLICLYKSINSNTSVPISYVTTEGTKLGEWINRQYSSQDRISLTQISMLDSISFHRDVTVNK